MNRVVISDRERLREIARRLRHIADGEGVTAEVALHMAGEIDEILDAADKLDEIDAARA